VSASAEPATSDGPGPVPPVRGLFFMNASKTKA
jgi:hypothetical protein